ncbi:MAG: hypothetical protein WHT26_04150, partial [Thermus sp.]
MAGSGSPSWKLPRFQDRAFSAFPPAPWQNGPMGYLLLAYLLGSLVGGLLFFPEVRGKDLP